MNTVALHICKQFFIEINDYDCIKQIIFHIFPLIVFNDLQCVHGYTLNLKMYPNDVFLYV